MPRTNAEIGPEGRFDSKPVSLSGGYTQRRSNAPEMSRAVSAFCAILMIVPDISPTERPRPLISVTRPAIIVRG